MKAFFEYTLESARRLVFRTLLPILCLVLLLQSARADDDVDAANHAYASGSYEEAASLFQRIVDQRGYSAPLCLNLANAEAHAGHPGLALLNYERARYLAPADAEIDHNLQLERKKAGLQPDTYRWWEIMLLSIDWSVWMGCFAAGLLLIFLAIVGFSFLPGLSARTNSPAPVLRRVFKLVLFIGIPVCLLLGFIELATLGFNQRIDGVIVAPKSATVLVSPFDTSDTRGVIPEGELVTVEDRHNEYLWVAARDNAYGWVRASDVAPVIAGSF
jgi:tetratricopeptide (TPR) repeat protein